MAFRVVFLAGLLASLTAALVPPCLPELGFEFCPTAEHASLASKGPRTPKISAVFPQTLVHEAELKADIFPRISTSRMESSLSRYADASLYPNRHCKSKFGAGLAETIGLELKMLMADKKVTEFPIGARLVENRTPQESLVWRVLAREPKSQWFEPKNTIVVGAHMDSNAAYNGKNYDDMQAPGADDNGSGVAVLLEVYHALLPLFGRKDLINEVQFHWYGAEEIGLVGSDTVFENYKNSSWPVKAMLNLDMVGYSGAHKKGSPIMALQQDHNNQNLTDFVHKLINTYRSAKPGNMTCGYPCSDHASAYKHGFPSAMIGESTYIKGDSISPSGNPAIHTANDTVDRIDYDYMKEFVKVTAAFVAELAYTDFSKLE
ncbi:hypothetical protein BD289DRAFT_211029 [Coniella lustricola]|uniref:Peptide hydrolase n=1 Tax=Coniella lustricola TaxID=2025994 RepID=A0A2T3ABX2_9PEZI|nr:hypothetical protein BD289DRAFT_211029 [Coniella lustricola]